MKPLLTCLFLLLSLPSNAQLSIKDGVELRKMLLENVNELRDSMGLPALLENNFLQKAALDHSKYMVKNKELTHEEKGSRILVRLVIRRVSNS